MARFAGIVNISLERPRIFSHLTRTRFLHIEDSLERGKLRFFMGAFERGKGSSGIAYAFLGVDDARVVFNDMALGKPVEFVDYKGGKDGHDGVISRVLKIQTQEKQTWIQVANGPGQRLNDGAIKPHGKPNVEISIPLTIFEGRKLAFACLSYMQAWEISKAILFTTKEQRSTKEY
jgi:hypothetical protein